MSVYGIVYTGGFGLTVDPLNAKWLLEHNSEVELRRFNDLWLAYTWCAEEYSRRFLEQNPTIQHRVPSLEEVLAVPYHEPNFVENVPQSRFFATMSANYTAIYNNVEDLMDFVMAFDFPFTIKEFDSEVKAMQHINMIFMRSMMPRSAYIEGDFYTMRNIPSNRLLSMQPFKAWYQKSFQPPQPWPAPANYRQNYLPFSSPQPVLAPQAQSESTFLPASNPITSML